MFYLSFLIWLFICAITKNAIDLSILKNGRIKCYCFINPSILLAGKQHTRCDLLTNVAYFTEGQLPGDAILIAEPSIFFTPWIFIQRHHHSTFFTECIPDAIKFFKLFADIIKRNGGSWFVHRPSI